MKADHVLGEIEKQQTDQRVVGQIAEAGHDPVAAVLQAVAEALLSLTLETPLHEAACRGAAGVKRYGAVADAAWDDSVGRMRR